MRPRMARRPCRFPPAFQARRILFPGVNAAAVESHGQQDEAVRDEAPGAEIRQTLRRGSLRTLPGHNAASVPRTEIINAWRVLCCPIGGRSWASATLRKGAHSPI